MTTKTRQKGRSVPPTATPPKVASAAAPDPRLQNLGIELGVAGMQVLMEQFSFTEEQARSWLDAMMLRAHRNRGAK
jgi:hypothetical protein